MAIPDVRTIKGDSAVNIFVFYRDTDLYVSHLLIKLLTILSTSPLRLRLWRHLADQTSHASLWTDHIRLLELGELPTDAIAAWRARPRPAPEQFGSAVDMLAQIIVVEEGLLRSYEFHSSVHGVCDATRDLLFRLVEDERWHIPSSRRKLAEAAAFFADKRELAKVLNGYQLTEYQLYRAFGAGAYR